MRLIASILLGLGLCFRFVNLDQKIYWYDETFTSLRSSGYTEAEVVQHFSHAPVAQVPDLQRYQQPDPQRGLGETLHSLSTEDPQHPPLYYILASYWMRWVGSSVTAMRLLPAWLSLLAFPSAYWLCQEWLQQKDTTEQDAIDPRQVGWVAIGLIAVSPFHLLYAQEAREYSLWSVMTLLTTATLLRAMRVNSVASWLLYGLSLAASLYTFLFSIWMTAAHGIYVIALSKCRFSPTIAAYLLATLLAIAAFSPWIWITVHNLHQIQTVTDWTTHPRSLLSLAMSWASLLGRLFYDRSDGAIDRTVQAGLILLIGTAFCTLCRRTPPSIWLLPVALTAIPTLVLIVPDLILGGGRSTSPRYLLPTLCSIQLVVAYLLTSKMTIAPTLQGTKECDRSKWRWITAAVFTAGIVSGLTIVPAQTWWTKPHNQDTIAIAQILNQSTHPLVISDAETADLLSLSYFLKAETELVIRPRCYTCSIDASQEIDPSLLENLPDHRSIFLFHPRATKTWKQSLHKLQNYHPEVALSESSNPLWKLIQTPPTH
jgi:uncharacterized membrane protein